MLIPTVEDGLESYLRAALPLPRDVGEISFERPTGTWATQVNRITVNLFLYGISRSPTPPRPAASRPTGTAGMEQRPMLPMVQLSFLVSAWSGSTRDEHELLGDVLTKLITKQVLPPEHLTRPLNSSVALTLAVDEMNRPRELWSVLGSGFKASFTLLATVASDAYDWHAAAPSVRGVDATAAPTTNDADNHTPPERSTTTTRDDDGVLHLDSAADQREPANRPTTGRRR